MKDTTEINGKEYTLTEGEGGKLTLTPLIKQPRKPEAGDVWSKDGCDYLLDHKGYMALNKRGMRVEMRNCLSDSPWNTGGYAYLGKHHEVFVRRDEHVKISDVRDALSIEDINGNSVLTHMKDDNLKPSNLTYISTLARLSELDII